MTQNDWRERRENKLKQSNAQSCVGKKTFLTWKQAVSHQHKLKKGGALKRTGKRIEPLHPYQCLGCGGIHLGHDVDRDVKKKALRLRLRRRASQK